MNTQVVPLKYKDEREEKVLRWAEGEGKPVIDLADKVNQARLESVGIISVGSQQTPWAAFESTRALFERLSECLKRRRP